MPISRFIREPETASSMAFRPGKTKFHIKRPDDHAGEDRVTSEHIVFTPDEWGSGDWHYGRNHGGGNLDSDQKDIPQQAVPVGINLECFRETPATTPSVIIPKV